MTFVEFARARGLIPPQFIEPGKTYRVPTESHPKKKNGLIRLDADERAGIAWNPETGDAAKQWRSDARDIPEERAKDNAALTERLAKDREKRAAATLRAKAEWGAAAPIVGAAHPYLENKRITMDACGRIRVSNGNLLIPCFIRRNFSSLQRISATGEKKFATGAPTKGASFEIWRPRYSMTILCEGFATGATIFSACAMARVVVCFSAENLVTVAENGDWSGMVAIAADNDIDTKERIGINPGIECAERAAKIIGCGVAIPHPENGTDWQDVFAEQYERLEKAEESKPWKTSPHKLRASALSFVAPAMMRACKMVVEK